MPTTRPDSNPRPACSPYSSLFSKSSCIPRQMPSRGLPRPASSITTRSSPLARSFSAASPKAPTPGRISRSAVRSVAASALTQLSAPMKCSEERRENRFPTP